MSVVAYKIAINTGLLNFLYIFTKTLQETIMSLYFYIGILEWMPRLFLRKLLRKLEILEKLYANKRIYLRPTYFKENKRIKNCEKLLLCFRMILILFTF